MPALGGRIKVEFVWYQKPSRAYMLAIPTPAPKKKQKTIKQSIMQQKTTMTSNHI